MTLDEQIERIIALSAAKIGPKVLITDSAQIAKLGAKIRAKVDDGAPYARVKRNLPCLRVTLNRSGASYALELYSRTDFITHEYRDEWARAIGAPDSVVWYTRTHGYSLVTFWQVQP